MWTQQALPCAHSSWIYKRLLHYICSLLLCAESPSQKKMKLRYNIEGNASDRHERAIQKSVRERASTTDTQSRECYCKRHA